MYIQEDINKKFPVIPRNLSMNREINEAIDFMFNDR